MVVHEDDGEGVVLREGVDECAGVSPGWFGGDGAVEGEPFLSGAVEVAGVEFLGAVGGLSDEGDFAGDEGWDGEEGLEDGVGGVEELLL